MAQEEGKNLMKQQVRQMILFVGIAACCSPSVSSAFQAVDEMLWPERGIFPAYPAEEADGKTVRFSVFSGLLHDSNPFRLSDSTNPATTIGSSSKSDTIFRYGAGVDADLPISRQKVQLNARVERRDFDRFDVLDHTAYRLGAGWKWVAAPEWSGDLGYQRDHRLSSLADIQAPIRDMITSDYVYGSAGYRLDARWRVRGALDFWHHNHSEPTRATLDNRTGSGTIGFDYMTPAENSVGGQFKYTRGNFPNQQPVGPVVTVDNQFKEYETSLVAHWVVTGKSTFDARVGYTSREHEQVPQRDFGGWTGRLAYDWFVAAKTLLNFAVWREVHSYEDVQASYVVSRGASFGPAWAPTDKIVLQARLLYDKRNYQGDPGFVVTGAPEREDTFKGIRLSAGWTPRRFIELVGSVERGDRDSNVVGKDYDYTSWMANARIRF